MRFSKWSSCMIMAGCLLVLGPAASGQQSRPDNEITKLADDVYLFRLSSISRSL